jgi:hypothetical protein
MKFKLANGGEIEISGIRKVVKNTVRGKLRQEPTQLWELAFTKKGQRWLKYDMAKPIRPTAGMSDYEMKFMVNSATSMPHTRVWVHGDTCNLVEDVGIYEGIMKERYRNIPRFLRQMLMERGLSASVESP